VKAVAWFGNNRGFMGCARLALCAFGLALPALAEPLEIEARVDKDEVLVGEALTLQLHVSGVSKANPPDTSVIQDFTVQFRGTSQNVQVVNSHITRTLVFNYRLVPKRAGALTIPAIAVSAGGRMARSQPLVVRAVGAETKPDFELRQELSRPRCYVGEAVTLTVTWYLGQQPRNIDIDFPILANPAFTVPEPDLSTVQDPRSVWRLRNAVVVPRQGRGMLNGKPYTTVAFEFVLIPRQAGTLAIPAVVVSCDVLAGYRESRRRSPFGGILNDPFFGGGREEVLRTVSIHSNALTLQVRQVPATGRPANFAGHVGRYKIAAQAVPIEVNIGEPITLTLKISGPEYLEDVAAPALDRQPNLTADFKIPPEIESGKIENGVKTFTQTIRAKRADVTEIPAIELPYFDTETERYAVARTAPIPLEVKETKVVTAQDAEGHAPVVAGRALKAWSRGIMANYDDLGVLQDQYYGPETWLRSPSWIALLVLPPCAYFALLLATITIRRRQADPRAVQARKAAAVFRRALQRTRQPGTDPYAVVLQALRSYLGSKLRLAPGALTFADVDAPLTKRGVTPEQRLELGALFEACTAGRYAGGAGQDADPATLPRRALALVQQLERVLK